MKYVLTVILSFISLLVIQNLLVMRETIVSNKCQREKKVDYIKCVPEPIFLNYLNYNIGDCMAYKYFPVGLNKDDDEMIKGIACDGLFSYPINKFGY